jgi:uncharacterized phosphosugar-binding protein
MSKTKSHMTRYYEEICEHMKRIHDEEFAGIAEAARVLADHIKQDKLIYVWGPGGHSNMTAMEVFFRAGGLMHISAILDDGTLLSSGARRSMSMERTPGYGKVVISDNDIGEGDLLIITNAYGINATCIEGALEAKQRGATIIAVSSRRHAENSSPDHPARHPSKMNLHDIADYHLDCKVEIGDAKIAIPGIEQKVGAMSTFANAYTINSLILETVGLLAEEGVTPPIWRSGNSPGGDEANKQYMDRLVGRVRWL